MKKAWMAILAILVLAGCGSKYPSEAILENWPDDATPSGVVIELNTGVADNLQRLDEMEDEIHQYLRDPEGATLSFLRSVSRERRDRIEALRGEYAQAQAKLMDQYNQWRAATSVELEEAHAAQATLSTDWETFQSFVANAEARVAEIQEQIEEAEARQIELSGEVREYTNQRIVDDKLAVRQLGDRATALSWRSSTWRDGVDVSNFTCEQQKGRVTLDFIAEGRSCVFINYPVEELAGEEYDQVLRDAMHEYLLLDRQVGEKSTWNRRATGWHGDLHEAREEVKKVQILAENQTGTTARALEQRRQQVESRIERAERELSDAAEQLQEGHFASFIAIDHSLGFGTRVELRNVFEEHLQELRAEIVERATIKQVPIGNDGLAEGLSGKGDFVIALIDGTAPGYYGRTHVEHVAVFIDVANGEPTVRDDQLIIPVNDGIGGRGSYKSEEDPADMIFELFEYYIEE